MFIANGILFNHESERRGETFVTRKITRALGRIKMGLQNGLYLGNLDAKRDWGDAKEFVRAMWMMLQQKKADDYVIATGKTYSVKDFLKVAFDYASLDWKKYVKFDKRYLRPTEVDYLLGDSSKARRVLGWRNETTFEQLVYRMVDHDVEMAAREKRGNTK
jgi:GDPmannose 4,6-dehydratase